MGILSRSRDMFPKIWLIFEKVAIFQKIIFEKMPNLTLNLFLIFFFVSVWIFKISRFKNLLRNLRFLDLFFHFFFHDAGGLFILEKRGQVGQCWWRWSASYSWSSEPKMKRSTKKHPCYQDVDRIWRHHFHKYLKL